MSRWLDLARNHAELDVSTNSTNSTNSPASERNVESVGNVEVSSDRLGRPVRLAYAASEDEDDALALAAIEAGDRSYGAVATTTGLGATRACRAVARLQAKGWVGRDMKVVEAGD